MNKLIDNIKLPEDLKDLNPEDLKTVANELRDELIDRVSNSGGHFASSLGVNELTVALHHVFNSPEDKFVWDVGHQGYIHKMLTGRREELDNIRTSKGISGFLKRSESEHDAFGAGHAGTSISAAVGMAAAFKNNQEDKSVVAIIGDGSLTAGMAFEALNHAGDLELGNLIVVLNDNEMSISPNVGALSRLFSKAVTSSTSTKVRASMLFESFGFRYIGPVDGHNLDEVVDSLKRAKEQDIPVLLHVSTIKGYGYQPAEEDPLKWHGVSPFNRESSLPSYTKIFSDTLSKIAEQDSKVVGITAAMPSGTGLDKFQLKHPDKFYDVGICEQHAVTFAAGLACNGFKPVVAIYSTFLQRGFDQIVHDVCIQNLPVVFAMDRSGVVGNDGETHQGVFDIAYLRSIPNLTILSPKDENEFQHMLYTAINLNSPVALRYPRGSAEGVELDSELKIINVPEAEIIQEGNKVLLIALGPVNKYALEVSERLKKDSISATIINARSAKPLDQKLILDQIQKHSLVCTIEDHSISAGFGSAILEISNDNLKEIPEFMRFGIKDAFVSHGSQLEQHLANGLDPKSIYNSISKKLDSSKKLSIASNL
ncbi:UNVERIFIED_CONTAM: hypothetical protein GTU68_046729 [Idotea baltica]|nr:hypothetical protein [Idotea baltica]